MEPSDSGWRRVVEMKLNYVGRRWPSVTVTPVGKWVDNIDPGVTPENRSRFATLPPVFKLSVLDRNKGRAWRPTLAAPWVLFATLNIFDPRANSPLRRPLRRSLSNLIPGAERHGQLADTAATPGRSLDRVGPDGYRHGLGDRWEAPRTCPPISRRSRTEFRDGPVGRDQGGGAGGVEPAADGRLILTARNLSLLHGCRR